MGDTGTCSQEKKNEPSSIAIKHKMGIQKKDNSGTDI